MRHLGRSRRRRGARGATIIETVCAAAILAIGIAGLCNLAAASAAVHQAGVQKEAARRALERQVASVVASSFATILGTYDNTGFAVSLEGRSGETLRPQRGDADGLPGRLQVTAPTGNAAELLEIEARVDWQSAHGPQSLTRRMRVSRLGSGS